MDDEKKEKKDGSVEEAGRRGRKKDDGRFEGRGGVGKTDEGGVERNRCRRKKKRKDVV